MILKLKTNISNYKITNGKIFSLILFTSLLLIGCKNFLNGGDFIEQLNHSIEYNNSSFVTVNISTNYGTVLNVGDNNLKVGDTLKLLYIEGTSGYQFVKWNVTPADCVDFSKNNNNQSTENFSEAEITVTKNVEKIIITPVLYIRPVFDSTKTEPAYVRTGVPKNSSIYFTCNQKLSLENDVSTITITNEDGKSLYGNENSEENYFSAATIDEYNIIISSTKNFLDVIDLEKITVTVPKDFYYETSEGDKIFFESDYVYTYIINNETQNKAEVNISTEFGSISPDGLNNYSIGESFELSFLNIDGYEFSGWAVVAGDGYKGKEVYDSGSSTDGIIQLVKYDDEGNVVSDAPTIDLFRFKDPTESEQNVLKAQKISKRTLVVLTNYSGILIKTNGILIPKIESYEPQYLNTGHDFDIPITVTFNKEVDLNSFNQNFIEITRNVSDYTDYYVPTAKNENGKTILTLTPKYTIKQLFPSESAVLEFIVSIKNDKIKDLDGTTMKAYPSWTHRIRYGYETEKPVIYAEDSKVFKDMADYSSNSNRLIITPESEWSDENYTQNHIKNKVYLSLSVSDNKSGVKSVYVTEKCLINENGTNINSIVCTDRKIKDFEIVSAQKHEELVEYELNSPTDGLIYLEFKIQDTAGNISQNVLPLYVIKDTKFNFSNTLIQNTPPMKNLEGKTIDDIKACVEKVHFTVTDKWLQKDGKIYETVYNLDKKNPNINIKLYAGTDDANLPQKDFTINEAEKSVILDLANVLGSKDTYIKIIAKDIYGNEGEYITAVPKKSGFFGWKRYNNGSGGSYQFEFLVETIENNYLHLTANEQCFYYFKEQDNTLYYYQKNFSFEPEENIQYQFYTLQKYKLQNINKESVLYSVPSNAINAKKNDDDIKNLTQEQLPDYTVTRKVNPQNRSMDIIEIKLNQSYSDEYLYFFNISPNLLNITTGNNQLVTEGEYEIFPGNKYYISPRCVINNNTLNNNTYRSQVYKEIEKLTVDYDRFSPSYEDVDSVYPSAFCCSLISDYIIDDKSLDVDANGYMTIEYWVSPCSVGYHQLTETQLEQLPNKRTFKFKTSDSQCSNGFVTSFPALEEGSYFVATRFYDKAGNYHFAIDSTFNLAFLQNDFGFVKNGKSYTVTIENESPKTGSYDDWYTGCEYFDITDKVWKLKQQVGIATVTDGKRTGTFTVDDDCFICINVRCWDESTSPYTKYFTTPKILYNSDNNICYTKQFDKITNNVMLFNSDKPYLVMLLTSPKNYGADKSKWLKYSYSADIQQCEDKDFYSVDMSKVLTDEYYVVCCVFADGETVMTEPVQKK